MDTGRSAEKKLINRCLSQDNKAWAGFVDEYNRLIYKAISQTLKKHAFPPENEIVDDLFQSVFLSLVERNCKKLRQFKWNCKLSSWLYIIAVRETIDFLRRQTIPPLSLNGNTDPETSARRQLSNGKPNPGDQIEQKEERRLLETMKNSLKPREQFFVELYYMRELSVSEVAQVMNIEPNNVYQMKSRIRDKMRDMIEKIV